MNAQADSSVSQGVRCPCCGWTGTVFEPFGRRPRPNALCPGCGSLERHRLLLLYLQRETTLLSTPSRLLHVAPEAPLRGVLGALPHIEYITTDLERQDVSVRMDVMDMLFRDEVFDVVICSHVLEHVSDDRAALRELRRVLRPSGVAFVLVPILGTPSGRTYEDPRVISPAERERLFGQHDHVRRYADDFPDRVRVAGLDVGAVGPRDFLGASADAFGLLSEERIFICSKRSESDATSVHGATSRC
jgi:SAM-dependent methyltransferase